MRVFVLEFEKRGGLVTVVTVDRSTRDVLMVAYANAEAWRLTLETGVAHYFSTSRGKLWKKGEESGNVQCVSDVLVDCDGDALVYVVDQVGSGACHTGARTCLFRSVIGARQLFAAPRMSDKETLDVVDLPVHRTLVPHFPQEWPRNLSRGSSGDKEDALCFVIPTGSLGPRTRALLQQIGYPISEPDARGYCGTCNGVAFFQRDRRMVPRQVACSFDAGLTGKDLLLASGVEGLRIVKELCFSRRSNQPTRWVLASRERQLPSDGNITVGCEYPVLAQKLLGEMGLSCTFTVVAIEGTEEQTIADGLCTHVLVVTETGGSLKRAGLAVVEGCENLLVSVPVIVAKSSLSAAKERRLTELSLALWAVLTADERVMVKANIRLDRLQAVQLPAADAPTVTPLHSDNLVAVEVCIPKGAIAETILLLHEAGATAIAVQDLKGFLE